MEKVGIIVCCQIRQLDKSISSSAASIFKCYNALCLLIRTAADDNEAECACAAAAISAVALPSSCGSAQETFDRGVRSASSQLERQDVLCRPSLNVDVRLASFNVSTATDRTKLLSLCG